MWDFAYRWETCIRKDVQSTRLLRLVLSLINNEIDFKLYPRCMSTQNYLESRKFVDVQTQNLQNKHYFLFTHSDIVL